MFWGRPFTSRKIKGFELYNPLFGRRGFMLIFMFYTIIYARVGCIKKASPERERARVAASKFVSILLQEAKGYHGCPLNTLEDSLSHGRSRPKEICSVLPRRRVTVINSGPNSTFQRAGITFPTQVSTRKSIRRFRKLSRARERFHVVTAIVILHTIYSSRSWLRIFPFSASEKAVTDDLRI